MPDAYHICNAHLHFIFSGPKLLLSAPSQRPSHKYKNPQRVKTSLQVTFERLFSELNIPH
jgi:hypothetical protein